MEKGPARNVGKWSRLDALLSWKASKRWRDFFGIHSAAIVRDFIAKKAGFYPNINRQSRCMPKTLGSTPLNVSTPTRGTNSSIADCHGGGNSRQPRTRRRYRV